MCGRFLLFAPSSQIIEQFELSQELGALQPDYNIAPGRMVVTLSAESGARLARPRLWQLIPSWTKDRSSLPWMINAKVETVTEKPSFRSAILRRRCLVPASGFYEWQTEGKVKRPFLFYQAEFQPLAMAAIWESWQGSLRRRS